MTEQQIEALVQKYAEGSATTAEVQQLMDWYRIAPVEEVVWSADHAKEKDVVYQRMLKRLQDSLAIKRSRLYWLTPLRAAAMIAAVLISLALFYGWPASPIKYTAITNNSGQIRHVRLPDKSNVWLNAATTLRYADAFNEHRQLQLDGEAYFDVTHDPDHPFMIESGELNITVLGTRFNISSYVTSKSTIVSLLQGKVSITAAEKQLAVLAPRTQMEWDRVTKKMHIKAIDTNAVVSWKAGRLQFQGQPLREIVETLEHWYGVRFHFANPGLGECRYYMSFDNTLPLKDMLALLAEVTNMEFAADKQTITISGKSCQ